jgi:hypothetical protein
VEHQGHAAQHVSCPQTQRVRSRARWPRAAHGRENIGVRIFKFRPFSDERHLSSRTCGLPT